MTGFSLGLAQRIDAITYADLSPGVVRITKSSLMDAIGVSLGASGLGEGVQPFIDIALDGGGKEEASILGVGRKVPMLMAALANGAMAHALDFEDAHDGALMHPNAQIVPALLAIAQARGPVSGQEFLTALAVGCDLVCRLRLAAHIDPSDRGWYGPALFGTIGAAVASAKLMKANPEQIVDAISWAIGPAAASAETKYSPRSHFRAVRDAFSAHAGLLAARVAMGGVRGFDEPLEGKAGFFALYAGGGFDEDVLLADYGRRFEGEFVSFKAWPACRGTHAFIELALGMKADKGVTAADIDHMTLTGGPIQQMLIEPKEQRLRPKTAIDAKFSSAFTTALAFVREQPTLADYRPEGLDDPAILALARRARCEIEPDNGRPMSWGRLEVTLKDGTVLSGESTEPTGHPAKPLGWDKLAAKYAACAAYAQQPPSPAQIQRQIAAIAALDAAPDAGAALFEPEESS